MDWAVGGGAVEVETDNLLIEGGYVENAAELRWS